MSVEQGFDPRDFSLVAFGGAGPLHANALGKLLGAYPVIVPPSPGVLCAFGDATTLLRHEVGRSHIRVLRLTDMDELINSFSELLHEVKTVMRDEQGVADQKQVWTRESHLSFFDRRPLITFSCIQSVAADLES